MKSQPRYKKGDKIGGRYLVHDVKMGGMGEVYLCLDLEQKIPLALKTFQQRYLTAAHRLHRAFEQEVATWIALEKHPNIVRCYWMQLLDNQPFMCLEWIAGEEGKGTDLRSWLHHGPLDLKLALQIAIDICNGLLHAQTKRPGLVHRDLKPENILMARGGLAKITDFGLAQITQTAGLVLDDASVTSASAAQEHRQSMIGGQGIVGTPAYMAPEQWRGEPLDARTDIYALGCILYELLTGGSPFPVSVPATTPNRSAVWLHILQQAHEQAAVTPLPTGLPATVNDLVQRCLAKAPSARYADLAALLNHLTSLYQAAFNQPPLVRPALTTFAAVDYYNRGVTYHDLGQYTQALADFTHAIHLDPTSAQTYLNRANVLTQMHHANEALADFAQAIALDPSDGNAFYNRGVLYEQMQRRAEASADYTHAIELDPTHAKAYLNRGVMAGKEQRYTEALADLTHAIELDPTNPKAYSNRGQTYAGQQRHGEALTDFTRAIKLDPAYANAYFNRAISYAALQHFAEALADLQRTTELTPNDAEVHMMIGSILTRRGALREALAHFEQAARLGHPYGAHLANAVRDSLR